MSDRKLSETASVPDLRGVPVFVGDTIAAAFSVGTSPELRGGKVVGLYTREGTYGSPETLLEVEWFTYGYYRSTNKTKIRAQLRRFMKVELPET